MIIEIGLFWHRQYVLLIAPVHRSCANPCIRRPGRSRKLKEHRLHRGVLVAVGATGRYKNVSQFPQPKLMCSFCEAQRGYLVTGSRVHPPSAPRSPRNRLQLALAIAAAPARNGLATALRHKICCMNNFKACSTVAACQCYTCYPSGQARNYVVWLFHFEAQMAILVRLWSFNGSEAIY